MMRRLVVGFAIVATVIKPSYGQLIPETAQSHLYFPQFVDGGPASGQLQTTFTFANSYDSTVYVTLYLMGNDGSPLTLDFGGGANSQFSFPIPPRGTRILQSRMTSPTIISGWAEAFSTVPVQGVVSYRLFQNGAPTWETSVPGTLPTIAYFSAASADAGVALANPSKTTILSLTVTAHGNDGFIGSGVVTLAPQAKRAFILREVITSLNPTFVGTIDIGGANTPLPEFVALTLKGDNRGIYSSLPSGAVAFPVSQFERIWRVYTKVFDAARHYIPSPDTVRIFISSNRVINASANANGITINLATAELIADSDSELAAVIGHELGHVYQRRTGILKFDLNPEWDADKWGLLLSVLSGYDPYGSAGALGKVYMATGDASLVSQYYDDHDSTDMHKGLGSRLDNIYTMISHLCSSTDGASACLVYRQLFHPHMPGGLLLTSEPE